MKRERARYSVDGEDYEIAPMLTSEQIKVWTRLVKILGPALSSLLKGKTKVSEILDAEVNLEAALGELLSRLGEDELLENVNMLLNERYFSHGGGQRVDFEEHFSGRLIHLGKVFVKALEVNFGDFFVVLKGGTSLSQPTPKPALKPPQRR